MLIKQQEFKGTKKKYSEIKDINSFTVGSRTSQVKAENTIRLLLDNGYAVMSAYHINEIFKTMRVLRELHIEYNLKIINFGRTDMDKTYYEFTTSKFEDDRDKIK